MRGPSQGHCMALTLALHQLTLRPVCQHGYREVDLSWVGAGC